MLASKLNMAGNCINAPYFFSFVTDFHPQCRVSPCFEQFSCGTDVWTQAFTTNSDWLRAVQFNVTPVQITHYNSGL